MNWGDHLTVVGAIRCDGWVVLNTKRRAMTEVAFIEWVRRRLAPRLRDGDIVLIDNLQAHTAPEVRSLIEARGATIKPLPPYSHDFNPVEPAWGLVKKRIRDHASPPGAALRRPSRRHALPLSSVLRPCGVRPRKWEPGLGHCGLLIVARFVLGRWDVAIGLSKRRMLNQSTHASVVNATAPNVRHGPRRRMTSVLKSPITD